MLSGSKVSGESHSRRTPQPELWPMLLRLDQVGHGIPLLELCGLEKERLETRLMAAGKKIRRLWTVKIERGERETAYFHRKW